MVVKRIYKIEGLAEKPEHSTMIQDGVSKIANVDSAVVDGPKGEITVEISSDHGVMEQLIQYVVHKSDADFKLQLLKEE